MNKFYITTSIAYVNAKPHIGFAMEVIQADVLARYHRLRGDETMYLTGTDEHGMKLAQTAKEQGISPQQLVDQNSVFFRDLRTLLNLSNDHFVRTTDDEHVRGAQKIWKKMADAGDLYKSSYEGLYCVGCEAFITEKDLLDGKCPNHNRVPEKLKEENYFFKLSRYSEQIRHKIETDELKIVPESKKNEILEVLKDGLKDVSFSRPRHMLEWGIDVPGDPEQVMYVWGDALSNYVTGVGFADETEQYRKFWPADVHLIGKDILRFHAAIWIGMLISAELPLPRAIYVHGHITSNGKKMSKSLNNVVDPLDMVAKFGIDPLRYYLLREIPTTDDGDFSLERFRIVYESELANTIGNLVSRVLAMTQKYFEGSIPPVPADLRSFPREVETLWANFDRSMADFDLKKALEYVLDFASFANEYVEASKPWVLVKENPAMLAESMYVLLEMIRHIAVLLQSFLPSTSSKILAYLGCGSEDVLYKDARAWALLKPGQLVSKAEPLFPRIVEA